MSFTRPAPRVKQMDYTPRARTPASPVEQTALVVPLPKEQPWRSEEYRRLVASYPCIHCGRSGPSQAAHADQGKGLGIKSDDRTAFPLCADGPSRRGCHSLIGIDAMFTRNQRRILERNYGGATRERIKAEGKWKPEWPELVEPCES